MKTGPGSEQAGPTQPGGWDKVVGKGRAMSKSRTGGRGKDHGVGTEQVQGPGKSCNLLSAHPCDGRQNSMGRDV